MFVCFVFFCFIGEFEIILFIYLFFLDCVMKFNILNESVSIVFLLFYIDFINIVGVVVVGFVIVFIIFGNVIVCVSFYIFCDF